MRPVSRIILLLAASVLAASGWGGGLASAATTKPALRKWWDVVTGSHFDDVVASDTYTARKNTVLLLYRPECRPNVTYVPAENHLLVLGYDTQTTPRHVWYEPRPTDDLFKRYGRGDTSTCLTAMFFDEGRELNAKPYYWHPEEDDAKDLTTWINDFAKVKLKFTNKFDTSIKIKEVKTDGSSTVEFFYPDETVAGAASMGDVIEFTHISNDNQIYQMIVTKDITLTIKPGMASLDVKLQMRMAEEKQKWWQDWLEANELRHLTMLKQPIFVQNYTTKGYRIHRVPVPVFNILWKFLQDNYDNRIEQSIEANKMGLLSNKAEISPALIPLTSGDALGISDMIKPLLEAWCKCQLKYTEAYGIWQFHRGTQLSRQVDRINRHAISAVLHLEKDRNKDTETDWALEVVDYNGRPQVLHLRQMEMLMYESAKLIHGWPYKYQGNTYTMVFFHFVPVTGWEYTNKDGALRDLGEGRVEPLRQLFTPLTATRGRPIIQPKGPTRRDEL